MAATDAAEVIRQLRRRVPGLKQWAIARMCGVHQSTISRVERGRPLDRNLAQAALEGLGAPTPETPLPSRSSAAVLPGDAALAGSFVSYAGTTVFGGTPIPVSALMDGIRPTTTIPTRVSAQDVAYLEQTTNLMERWDFLHGGGLSRSAVLGQLHHVSEVYRHASCGPQVRNLLRVALARISKVAGWMAFDDHDLTTARRCWLLGLSMATEAQDPLVLTSLLTDMARAAIHNGAPKDALDMLGMASGSARESSHLLRTAAAVVTARAHGALGHRRECLSHIEAAHDYFEHHDQGDDPEWMSFYDTAQLAGDAGQALHPIAMGGHDRAQTVDLLGKAVHGHTADAARASTLSRAKLARLHLAMEDLQSADEASAPLLSAVTTVRSARVRQDLLELSSATIAFGNDPVASRMRHNVERTLQEFPR
ncbi:helix-turn-helix domain-containing protein [Nocardiopsis alborubida]|uniref:Helix-turn-helix transcriptional regulator n=1 Tax=Nocardiopsis alborubida TaxID=146802 RepID=A0A7X6MA02_9ACTN|nr:helix-turn-helix transcriptional regulator [Nocardiopsis alborubida]NKY96739.1 helix-turn-helix transcriptional regulator [Nocardiopsis alborubida]